MLILRVILGLVLDASDSSSDLRRNPKLHFAVWATDQAFSEVVRDNELLFARDALGLDTQEISLDLRVRSMLDRNENLLFRFENRTDRVLDSYDFGR